MRELQLYIILCALYVVFMLFHVFALCDTSFPCRPIADDLLHLHIGLIKES
jgi:hypothetical protein